jgi:hypothetical protein
MDPMTMALMGGSVISSLAGLFGGGDDAKKYTDQAVQELIKQQVPDPAQQRIELQHYMSAGTLSPQLEHVIQQNPSALEGVVKNQKYAQAQDKALSQLQDIGESGGLTLSDKANLQDQMIQNAVKDRGNREAITDDMARRGALGSGMALQAQLANSQAAGDRDAQMRLKALGGAQDRALAAIQGAGDMAGKLSAADLDQQNTVAAAKDAISRFNTANAQGVQQRNVGALNDAQQFNLTNAQKLSNANTDLSNDEQKYNKGLIQQNFDNNMKKAQGVANAYTGAAQQANNDRQRQSQAFGAVGSGLGQLGSTVQSQNNWDQWLDTVKKKKAPLAGESYFDGGTVG